ncbi:MAG: hypothetical protein AAFR79_02155 [Pseudomonadota bacterium]
MFDGDSSASTLDHPAFCPAREAEDLEKLRRRRGVLFHLWMVAVLQGSLEGLGL